MGDEANARDLLVEMQARLGRDPHEALGLAGSPSAGEIRNAFLTLTKRFHPQKFARMAPDIQRLANEVFLSLRAAHDTLSRPTSASTRKSGPMPTLQSLPRPNGAAPPVSRAPTPPVMPRGPTASGSGAMPPTPTPHVPAGQPVRPFTNARPAAGPVGARPTPAPTATPAKPATPIATAQADPLVPILELIKLGQLPAARIALEALTARSPNVPQYQALLHYARGREAQLSKRVDEARVELQDALQIDPDLALAKTALAELFTRRK
ncbi:MAG: hypothetical protein ACKV2T_11175 [Kofleriaceae bacterium]